MSFSPTRHRVALVIALVGMAFAIFTEYAHQHPAIGGALCQAGGLVDCDVVIGSRFGKFLGVPVAAWGALAFGVGAALAVPGALGASIPLADLALLALASWNLGFAIVLIVVMTTVLQQLCLFCLAIDTIVLAWFATLVPLAARFDTIRWRGLARGVVLASVLLALASGTVAAVGGPMAPGASLTAAEVRSRDPKFAEEYAKLPLVAAAEAAGGSRHEKGSPTAPVTIVEFSDFECPACGQAFDVLHRLIDGRSDVRLVFRHFPLDSNCNPMLDRSLHQSACFAAAAAECAGQQQRFWEMHDLLFANQATLTKESTQGYRDGVFRFANELALDLPSFRTCLADPDTLAKISEDVAAGLKVGLQSTPTLCLNGRVVQGVLDQPYFDYALALEREAAKR